MDNPVKEYYIQIDQTKGFCDKLDHLLKTWPVAKRQKIKLNVYESESVYCGVSFLDVFENLDQTIKIYDRNKVQPDDQMKRLSCTAYAWVKESQELLNYLFGSCLREDIKKKLNFNIPINTFGVHMRTKDFILGNKKLTDVDRASLNIDARSKDVIDKFLEDKLQKNDLFLNCDSVFICSSGLAHEEYLAKKINKKIIINKKQHHKKSAYTDRSTKEGMIEALNDLVCLSQCVSSMSKSMWNYGSKFQALAKNLTAFNKNDI